LRMMSSAPATIFRFPPARSILAQQSIDVFPQNVYSGEDRGLALKRRSEGLTARKEFKYRCKASDSDS
jgi:hypothetical protein